MLERLDDIDWAALRHAYGSAHETPRWIRGLASADPEIRTQAWSKFDAAVLHQGFVYDATPWAIPFLFELLSDRETPDRAEIAELIAIAANSIVQGRRDPDLLAKDAPPEFQIFDRIEEELTAALPTLGTLAGPGETDGEVRLWVLDILRTLGEAAAPVVKLLPNFREEPDEQLRIALLYLAHVTGLTDLAVVRASLEEDGSPVVRWTAALVELRTEKQRTSERAIRELVAALEPGCDTLNRKKPPPLPRGPLTEVTVAAGEAGPEIQARLLPGLIRRAWTESPAWTKSAAGPEESLDRSEIKQLLMRVDLLEPGFLPALFSCAFGSPPATFTGPLTEMQRKVLHAAAHAAWRKGRVSFPGMSEASELLQTFGFPTERADLQAMIGPELPLPPSWSTRPRAVAPRPSAASAPHRLHRAREAPAWIWTLFPWLLSALAMGALAYAMTCQHLE